MAKKKYYAILETVATNKDMVADIAIIICDRQGAIFNQVAVVVKECYGDFLSQNDLAYADSYDYAGKLNSGRRMLASVVAVNHWIGQAFAKYNPELISWDLALHLDRCEKTGIGLGVFGARICLRKVAQNILFNSKKFLKFSGLDVNSHDSMISDDCLLPDLKKALEFVSVESKVEFTALEKARDAVMPVLSSLVNNKSWRKVVSQYDGRSTNDVGCVT